MAIIRISFCIREIDNGFIVTINGEEIFYPDWLDVLNKYFRLDPTDLGFDKADKNVTFEVNHIVLSAK